MGFASVAKPIFYTPGGKDISMDDNIEKYVEGALLRVIVASFAVCRICRPCPPEQILKGMKR